MKKILILGILFLSLSNLVNAQRHIKGIKAVDFMGGVTGKGYYGEAGYAHYINNKFYMTGRLRYESGKLNDSLSFTGYSLNVAANYTLWNPSEGFFLNGTGGGSFFVNSLPKKTFESVSYNEDIKQNSYTYGVFAGVEAEIFLGNRVVWLMNFRQNFNIKNDIGRFAFFAGTGLRFNIY